MKGLLCALLLLESFVFVFQQQVDGGLSEKEISSENRRQIQRDEALTDIHAALRELTATVTEQKAHITALETRLKEATDEMSNFTESRVEELRKKYRVREIAFSASLMESGGGYLGPFATDVTLTYRKVFTNIGNAYDPNTGIFTAPLKGVYKFSFSVFGHGNPTIPSSVSIMKNGVRVVSAHAHQDQYDVNSSNGAVLMLEVGDVVHLSLWGTKWIYDNENNHNTFSGYLLFPLR